MAVKTHRSQLLLLLLRLLLLLLLLLHHHLPQGIRLNQSDFLTGFLVVFHRVYPH